MSMKPQLRLWHAMREQRWEIAGAALLGIVASLSAVALIGTSGWLIATASTAPPVLTLTMAAVMVRAFALARAVFRYAERLAGHDGAFRGLVGLRVAVFGQLERLAPAGLSQFGRGDLLSRLVGDVDAAVDLPLRVVLPWVQGIVVMAGAAVFFWVLLPPLGAVMVVLGVVATVLVPWLVSRTTAAVERRIAPLEAALASRVVTSFESVADIEAFGASERVLHALGSVDDALTQLGRREAFGLGLSGGVMTMIQGAAVVASLCLAVPNVQDGLLEPVWLAVAALVPLAVFDVLATIPGAAAAAHRVQGSAQRIDALSQVSSPVHEPATPTPLPTGFQQLVVRELEVRWASDGPVVVSGVGFTLRQGEHLYVVGPSGSGKSTLAAVLMGFVDYNGSVRINDVELADADHDAARERIGLVSQQAHIFNTSIAENITLGRQELTRQDLVRAVTGAHLDAMVARLPDGVDAQVGAFGSSISGGEAQRVALARLLIDPRPVVVLDEPTEHLDPRTAAAVEEVLRAQTQDSATITITHHLLDIPEDAEVLVLTPGRVDAQGTCGALRAQGGWFADQWQAQFDSRQVAQGAG